jgi:RNase adaptor protein for sRNA GlmZ degradation
MTRANEGKETDMAKKIKNLQELSERLSAIADEVMETSSMETDELSAHLWILRSVTIRDYADSMASLARAAQQQKA